MRVITPDVGGGFGTKLFPYREYALAAVAARTLKRPVKWVADRTEHFSATRRAATTSPRRGWRSTTDGRFLALAVDLVGDMGAYLSTLRALHSLCRRGMLPGVYDIPAVHVPRARRPITNTVPVDAYRGAGRPEAAYVIERLVDAAARELGDRAGRDAPQELHQAEGDAVHDRDRQGLRLRRVRRASGARAGDRRLEGFRQARARRAKKRGQLRGIGLATYVEACGDNGPETARCCGSSRTATSPC